ncbi:MAG: ATP-dependent helicase [Bacillota bacterium]
MNLNEEQKRVVYSNERFLFLLASAGSGKTRVIVERIKYLIEQGVDPTKILAITFTRKAAFEMKQRTKNEEVNIHTFHQFCYLKLIENSNQTIKIIEEETLPFTKIELLEVTKYKNSIYTLPKPKVYNTYQTHLKTNGIKDFDDLLLDFYQLIRKVTHTYLYDYIFIDEFQDTNHLQYAVLGKLVRPQTSVLAVGDPDQSIYHFRGASSKIIYKFINDYQAKLYTLSVNYRSNQTIITHANRLIKQNNRRYQKYLIPNDLSNQPVYHLCFFNEIEEAITLLELIRNLQKVIRFDKDIAILYRNNKRCFEIKKVLSENDINWSNAEHQNNEKQGIQLMTIHRAKGLEFDAVIIIGLEQGTLPSLQQNSQFMLDEERRLMFVAMTRARKYLYFSSIHLSTQNHTLTSSQFIHESGVKTIKNRHINDIISLGDFNERKAKNSGIDQNS